MNGKWLDETDERTIDCKWTLLHWPRYLELIYSCLTPPTTPSPRIIIDVATFSLAHVLRRGWRRQHAAGESTNEGQSFHSRVLAKGGIDYCCSGLAVNYGRG